MAYPGFYDLHGQRETLFRPDSSSSSSNSATPHDKEVIFPVIKVFLSKANILQIQKPTPI